MRTSIINLSAAIAFVFASCSQGHSHDNIKKDPTVEKISNEQVDGIKLNNGKKWKANPETTQGINNMQTLVKKQLANEKKDPVKLQENLNKEFKTIFQKCTMTGEAHDQLHNYLIPLKDRIKQIDTETSKTDLEKLSAYLESYKTYFE